MNVTELVEGQEVKITAYAEVLEIGGNFIEVELENGDTLTIRTDRDTWKIKS